MWQKHQRTIFFLTLFKILKNYHSIAVRHYKCCLATSAWKEVVCANCVLVGYSSVFTVETFFFHKWRKVKKKTDAALASDLRLSEGEREKSLLVRASAWLTFL